MSNINQEEKTKGKQKLFVPNPQYFTICVYILGLILAACIGINLFYHWDNTIVHIKNLFSSLSSFLFGILIAFMVNPLVQYIQNKHMEPLFKKRKKVSQFSAIFVSYLIVFGFIIICLVYVIPQLIESISDLSASLPGMYTAFTSWLRNFAYNNEFLSNNFVNNIINTMTPKILDLSTNLASQLIPWLYSASIAIIRWFVTLIIAIMVSIYLLADRKLISYNMKRFLFAFLPQNMVNHSVEIAKNCNQIFTGYIIAKAIDSLIIGCLCFILMSIFRLPYAILIGVIVGITNMIPYFGPYIGALPGIFILTATKLRYGIIFLILIVALQQFDGLILGPRILGDSTGLRPILILFAITLGGAYFGVLGMFLGVPVIAVIQYLLNLWITKRLKDRNVEI
ncbi:MAG: AI-2E family transporter [Eubacteriales bacterium]|nr:AI-2E family transporter [Eubacteriales bacterium]